MTYEENRQRYQAAAHAMQTGVAMEMNYSDGPTSPKHLRVGVNSAMVEHSALAQLLLNKEIITKEEYMLALANGMEAEVKRYEAHLAAILGKSVTLL